MAPAAVESLFILWTQTLYDRMHLSSQIAFTTAYADLWLCPIICYVKLYFILHLLIRSV